MVRMKTVQALPDFRVLRVAASRTTLRFFVPEKMVLAVNFAGKGGVAVVPAGLTTTAIFTEPAKGAAGETLVTMELDAAARVTKGAGAGWILPMEDWMDSDSDGKMPLNHFEKSAASGGVRSSGGSSGGFPSAGGPGWGVDK